MQINEKNYIIRLKAQDERAMDYIIDRYGGMLMAVIRKRLYLLPDAAEECLDDVLMKIWLHAGDYDEAKGSFASWITAIARYQAINVLKHYQQQLKETVINEEMMDPASAADLSGQIENEISDEVSQMLSCLSAEDQQLFLRIYLDEVPVSSVSEETGLSRDTIYQRLSRGRKRIRQWFGKRSV